jgi:hypothetical protein
MPVACPFPTPPPLQALKEQKAAKEKEKDKPALKEVMNAGTGRQAQESSGGGGRTDAAEARRRKADAAARKQVKEEDDTQERKQQAEAVSGAA